MGLRNTTTSDSRSDGLSSWIPSWYRPTLKAVNALSPVMRVTMHSEPSDAETTRKSPQRTSQECKHGPPGAGMKVIVSKMSKVRSGSVALLTHRLNVRPPSMLQSIERGSRSSSC
ncbi:hypothetical protein DFP72DRAFT_1059655 [Ephemerocybe angulata]|uniref:Uncharacterized protein n=1 Tax=Ephemerocybe angulata TaxID=980116 RepID=A0A8H6MFN3_9AGAR|nr:hypothetical protein DFP72DRAFT_1059655 [Tulosesus angulatus]